VGGGEGGRARPMHVYIYIDRETVPENYKRIFVIGLRLNIYFSNDKLDNVRNFSEQTEFRSLLLDILLLEDSC
jgi:hypothetical protein